MDITQMSRRVGQYEWVTQLPTNGDRFLVQRSCGTFANARSIGVGGDPYRGMTLAHLNEDEFLDLLTPNPDHIAILIGDGSGGFAQSTTLQPGFAPFSVAAEVLVASYMGGEVAILTGGESPVLYRLEVEGYPYGFATGDFDGDGRVDFAVANDRTDQVTVFLSRS